MLCLWDHTLFPSVCVLGLSLVGIWEMHMQVLTVILQQMLIFTSLLFVGHITGGSLELDGAGQWLSSQRNESYFMLC